MPDAFVQPAVGTVVRFWPAVRATPR